MPLAGLYGCPRCHCTDIEQTAWVEVNSGLATDSEPPSPAEGWCPQCDESISEAWVIVHEEKPYRDEG